MYLIFHKSLFCYQWIKLVCVYVQEVDSKRTCLTLGTETSKNIETQGRREALELDRHLVYSILAPSDLT